MSWGDSFGDFFKAAITPSSILSTATSVAGNILDNEASLDAVHKANEFSGYMSNTSHVREVADLKAAGLNPILSARYGGASTPPSPVPNLRSSISNVADRMLTAEQIRNINADTIKKTNEGNYVKAQQDYLTGAQTEETLSKVLLNKSSSQLNDQQIKNLQEQIPMISAQIQAYSAAARRDHANASGMEADNVAKHIVAQLYADFPVLKQADEVARNTVIQIIKEGILTGVGKTVVNKTFNKIFSEDPSKVPTPENPIVPVK